MTEEINGWARDLHRAGLDVAGQRRLEAERPSLLPRPAGFWDAVEAEIARLEAEPRPLFWPFDSTGEAYDACQCDARIKSGDLLVIASEGVVGMAWAWPVAITVEAGAFHRANDASVITDADGVGAGVDQLVAAIEKCHELRFPVDPLFCNSYQILERNETWETLSGTTPIKRPSRRNWSRRALRHGGTGSSPNSA